jgi:hypothetical protein
LPVCPSSKCKLLTGTIEVYFFLLALRGGGLTGWRKLTTGDCEHTCQTICLRDS